jgi:hypothetical protein
VGLLEPTHGTALIGGYDIRSDMGSIYSLMGVCPQHDLLWETLTGREHLTFYGRLKGLDGARRRRLGGFLRGWAERGLEGSRGEAVIVEGPSFRVVVVWVLGPALSFGAWPP